MAKERDEFIQFSDEQLVYLIQHLNQDPFEVLLERYSPLIAKMVREFSVHGFDSEDLWQEARFVFHRIVHSYEKDKGVTLGVFFKLSLQNHLLSLVRKNQAEKRKSERQAASLDSMMENGDAYPFEYRVAEKDAPLDYIILDDQLKGFPEALSAFEREVFQAHMDKQSFEEIAQRLGETEARVKNAWERCRRKMRKYID